MTLPKEQLEECQHLLPRFLCRLCKEEPTHTKPKVERYRPKFEFVVDNDGKD